VLVKVVKGVDRAADGPVGKVEPGLKAQGERGFFVRFGVHADIAAVQAHDLARQTQADAGAVLLGCKKGNEEWVYAETCG